MPCFHPIRANQIADQHNRYQGIDFGPGKRGQNVVGTIMVPCGECIGCRMERARQWAARCMHEASLYEENCVLTLTYNEDHLPHDRGLAYEDYQKFMKRLRKKFAYNLPSKKHHGPSRKIRFFMCGEYGEDYGRPHYHACIFNFNPDDCVYFKTSKTGTPLYTSKSIEALWSDRDGNPIGFVTVGVLDINSASYIARYVMKKGFGQIDDEKYEFIDLETGEVATRDKEFNRMSLRPGIGSGFYDKHKRDMFPHDICVIDGKESKPPKYYYKKLAKDDGFVYDDIQYLRAKRARESAADNTPERLEVKETVFRARIAKLKRQI